MLKKGPGIVEMNYSKPRRTPRKELNNGMVVINSNSGNTFLILNLFLSISANPKAI